MWLPRDGNRGLSSQSAICLFSKVELCVPPPPVTLFHPSGSYGCSQASQYKLVITTLRTPGQPIAIGAGLPHEKSLVALLTMKNLDYPDGWGTYWKVDFWEFYSTVDGNRPLSIPQTASHSSSELTWWRNLA